LAVQLDGVSATVNGKPAFVSYISPLQVNVLTPPDAIQGPVQVQVTSGQFPSNSFTVVAEPTAPSFFVLNGGPYVVAQHGANYGLIGPIGLYPGFTSPAQRGETVLIYANGFGPTSVPVTTGAITQSGSLTPLPLVKIGGIAATVNFAGLIGPGEFQFNVVVPATVPDGDQLISVSQTGELTTQPGALISIQGAVR
jgi:uncharacterized protein (TIGR03437 family)